MKALIIIPLLALFIATSAYAAEPNLVAHWKFDEGEGTTAFVRLPRWR